eukprot:13766113-Alexandrium_andersonii.AAC.1
MSASLVGSEMCIRDRSVASSLLEAMRAATQTACMPTDWPTRLPVCLHAPVSYTHLTLPTICSV